MCNVWVGNIITSRVYQGVFFFGVFIGLDDVQSLSWTDELGESVICVILRLVELHELGLRWYPHTEAKEKNPDAPVYLHTLHPVVRERFTFFFASLRHLD